MAKYSRYGVKLSEGQKESLARALKKGSAMTIRLTADELMGPDELLLTQTQINKIKKHREMGKGVDLKISATQMRKMKAGGIAFAALAPFITPIVASALGVAAKHGVDAAIKAVKKKKKGSGPGFSRRGRKPGAGVFLPGTPAPNPQGGLIPKFTVDLEGWAKTGISELDKAQKKARKKIKDLL